MSVGGDSVTGGVPAQPARGAGTDASPVCVSNSDSRADHSSSATPSQPRITVIPITLPVANAYIERWHRHHAPLTTVTANGTVRLNKGFAWYSLAAIAEQEIVGVAVVGRPPNRHSDDGQTVEVLRLATNSTPNSCSALLGACARSARAMGASRIITYTLESESGVSLRAAGWERQLDGIETCWTHGQGKARNKRGGNTIWRPHMEEMKVRWGVTFRDPVEVDISREGLREYAASLVPVEAPQPSLWESEIA